MAAPKYKSHERLILDATVKSIFKHDLSSFGMQQRALGILNGAALALKAIGSQYVEGPIYPEFLRQGPVPDDSGVIATLTQVSPYGVPVMLKTVTSTVDEQYADRIASKAAGVHRGVDIESASGSAYPTVGDRIKVTLREPATLSPAPADEPKFGTVEWRARKQAELDARTPAEVASDIVESVVAQRRRDRG